MIKKMSILGVGLCATMLVVAGCGFGGGGTTDPLDNLVDANNNGFPDLVPPVGVDPTVVGTINIGLINGITDAEANALVEQMGVPGIALDFITVALDVTLDYGPGVDPATIAFVEQFEPFERKFEAACPDGVTANVTVAANIPLLGEIEIFTQTFTFTAGVEYECGQTILLETTVINGAPAVDLDIS